MIVLFSGLVLFSGAMPIKSNLGTVESVIKVRQENAASDVDAVCCSCQSNVDGSEDDSDMETDGRSGYNGICT